MWKRENELQEINKGVSVTNNGATESKTGARKSEGVQSRAIRIASDFVGQKIERQFWNLKIAIRKKHRIWCRKHRSGVNTHI